MALTKDTKTNVAGTKCDFTYWCVDNKSCTCVDVTAGCKEVIVVAECFCTARTILVCVSTSCNHCSIGIYIHTILHSIGLIFDQDTCAHSLNVGCVNCGICASCSQCSTHTVSNTIGLCIGHCTACGCGQGSIGGCNNCFVYGYTCSYSIVNIVFGSSILILEWLCHTIDNCIGKNNITCSIQV